MSKRELSPLKAGASLLASFLVAASLGGVAMLTLGALEPRRAPLSSTTIENLPGAEELNAQLAQAPAKVIDTSKAFTHNTHLNAKTVGEALKCETCHEMVTPKGQCPTSEVRFPKHEACFKCHAANFYTPPLTICVNCHKSAEMSKGNPLKELGRQVTPRKSEFNHNLHADPAGKVAKQFPKKVSCKSCHKVKAAGKRVTHPSHPNCCQCHTRESVKPKMSDCSACHSESRRVSRPESKIHSFTHRPDHMKNPDGTSRGCTECHVNGAQAKSIRQIKIPPMGSCTGCHNGDLAFSAADCLKCHKEGMLGGMMPASHPVTGAGK